MVNTKVRLIIFFAAKMEKLYTAKARQGGDCGSDHECLIDKFRLVGKPLEHSGMT